jgi:hypothetical protein
MFIPNQVLEVKLPKILTFFAYQKNARKNGKPEQIKIFFQLSHLKKSSSSMKNKNQKMWKRLLVSTVNDRKIKNTNPSFEREPVRNLCKNNAAIQSSAATG